MAEQTLFNRVKNYVFPTPENPIANQTGWKDEKNVDKNLRNYISPVQLQRLRHDVQMWRDAIIEAEQAYYPHRVRMQRMFIDTILSGHTFACIKRRKQLTLLREWSFKNEKEEENEKMKKLLNQKWFTTFLEYALEARFYGYTLVTLGDLVADNFPQIALIKRFNISPDRLNVTSYVYSLSGAQFLEDPYKDWHVWVPTVSDTGVSNVGYGSLYNVALYEIICRNLLGFNTDAAELYGMPARIGTTQKTEEHERKNFEAALAKMGSAGYILKDMLDEVELLETKGNGQGFKIYADLEKRCEAKISKMLLGHADALDSTPGKLGTGNGEDSPAGQALRDTQTEDGAFLEDVVNATLLPKLKKLGMSVDLTYKFCFSNNQEKVEARVKEDTNNKATADIAYVMTQAGLKMDAKYFTERTGIPATEETAPVETFSNRVKNKLQLLYNRA